MATVDGFVMDRFATSMAEATLDEKNASSSAQDLSAPREMKLETLMRIRDQLALKEKEVEELKKILQTSTRSIIYSILD